ncbi:hypothetical protein LOK49_LG08G01343 [Camellia lanceoleosa]|nr:hypothetical protein LOK49_LG08G01343 [Camellia lanceoleosa]
MKVSTIFVLQLHVDGQTAMDILTLARSGTNPVCPSDVCVKCLRRAEDLIKFDWLQRRDILMVVASVVAAMTFDAAENPPGGVWQDDKDGHKAGEAVMAYNNPQLYTYFFGFNDVGFIAALCLMLLLMNLVPLGKRSFLFVFVAINSLIIASITTSFAISNIAVTPNGRKGIGTKIEVTAIVCGVVIALYL